MGPSMTSPSPSTPRGALHVAYTSFVCGDVRHATNETGTWQVERLGEARAIVAGLDAGLDGVLHLVYWHHHAPDGVWVRRRSGGAWREPERILETDRITVARSAVGPAGDLHVVVAIIGEEPPLRLHHVFRDPPGSPGECSGD